VVVNDVSADAANATVTAIEAAGGKAVAVVAPVGSRVHRTLSPRKALTVTALKTVTIAELPGLVGTKIGTSDWIEISQQRIDTFADAVVEFISRVYP
jgi:hypothetical protein